MKRINKKIISLVLALSIICASVLGTSINSNAATLTTKTVTQYYSCRQHSKCMYVGLTADFHSSLGCTDVYFSKSYTHWPNGCTYGATKNYTSYARGTYTMYTSLITQWVSLAFQSSTDTLYVYR